MELGWHVIWPSPGNDHRFLVNFDPGLALSSKSRVFEQSSKVSVSSKLSEIHKHAWTVWKDELSGKRAYKLKERKIQEPGVIPPDVMEQLFEEIRQLPPPKKYGKKK